MEKYTHLILKPSLLSRYGLPCIPYPFAIERFAAHPDQDLPIADMLYGLQQCSSDGDANWQEMEPAMERLVQLLTPEDTRPLIAAAGDTWWLEIGPVDLDSQLVAIQRGEKLIAAIIPREDGRLRIAVFRPLDSKSAEYLIGLGVNPHPDNGVCMRANNWEHALGSSAGMGNCYASERGEAYLSYWEKGIGVSWDGSEVAEWRLYRELVPRCPAHVAMELGVHFTFDEGS
jgi:hypothetical protein